MSTAGSLVKSAISPLQMSLAGRSSRQLAAISLVSRGARLGRGSWVVLVVALAVVLVPAGAAAASGSPFANAANLVTGFPTCPNPGGGGMTTGAGGTSDATSLYIVDICNGAIYKLPLAGSAIAGAAKRCRAARTPRCSTTWAATTPSRRRRTASMRSIPRRSRSQKVYGPFPACARTLAGDPLSSALYVSGCAGITRIADPDGSKPVVSTFAPGNDDGLGFSPDGSELYAADLNAHALVGFTRAGKPNLDVSISAHGPEGLAVAPAGTTIGGVDVSGDIFLNDNDGTILRVDTAHGNTISPVAYGGKLGYAAFFDSRHRLDLEEVDRYVTLTSMSTTFAATAPPAVARSHRLGRPALR